LKDVNEELGPCKYGQQIGGFYFRGGTMLSELENIETFCHQHGIKKLDELIGAALKKEGTFDRPNEDAHAAIQRKSFCLTCPNKPCIDGCYFDAIRLKEDQSVEISADHCTACGLCAQVCPFPGALAMVKC
jgi:Fe-S-cluster-containing hydrogenase component 2